MNPHLDSLFRELLALDRGPGYGISVLSAAPDLSVIDVALRFIAGRSYCCVEPGCHLGFDNAELLRLAAAHSVSLPESVTVHWHCHVERGVRLGMMKSSGQLSVVSNSYDFVETIQSVHRQDGPPIK
jgi:hypothetical protein